MSMTLLQEPATNKSLAAWVGRMAELCGPERIVWCDGSEEERERLTAEAVRCGDVEELNQELLPGCLYARSRENDVARVEKLTFICTRAKEQAGPTNNWMSPAEAYAKLEEIFRGSMRKRTMYVVPFLMGVPGSPFNKVGIQLTDSLYVVLNMRIMTRMGRVALEELGDSADFTRCLHGKADLDENRRFICHFPEDNTVWSVGTNYGGNVLMGKKCLALRIGSWFGRREGWLAEHMLIMGIQNPEGEIRFVAAAFPSQCGKTNLAMLVPPASMAGYKIWTVGDDIAWIRPGADGRLWALNPENGFFGVAPGTNSKTNPNALEAIRRNTIYTNVAKTKDGGVWWEGKDGEPPAEATDWKGRPWTPASTLQAAHPNSRFTAPVSQCPSLWPDWENPKGVPLSAIIFGGRRSRLDPLVYEAFDWTHGVYAGATMASETTAAAVGRTGVVRRDPMAMLPFCGYHMADYFAHWLSVGKKLKNPPKIFHVNWFRKDNDGRFIWPGFGENLRVLRWILDRVDRKVDAVETPVGLLPFPSDIPLEGLELTETELESKLLAVNPHEWFDEMKEQERFFETFGSRLPKELVRLNQTMTDALLEEIDRQRKEKTVQITEEMVARHPFFQGVHEWYLEQLVRYAREQEFEDGEYLICEGMEANEFYLILEGRVAVGVGAKDKKGFKTVQTLERNDIVGWSWLIPPHRWHFDAVADGPVKAIVLDGTYLRAKCEEDPALGYELMKRMTGHVVDRLNALRAEVLEKKE